MKTFLTAFAAGLLCATAVFAGSGKTPPGQRENSWGDLTAEAVKGPGNSMGPHASAYAGEPRDGLPNLDGRGDLSATLDIIDPQPEE